MRKKRSGKFIGEAIISLIILCSPFVSEACWESESSRYDTYPFKVTSYQDVQGKPGASGYDETLDFWENYTQGKVSRDNIRTFFDNASYENSRNNSKYAFYNYLKDRNDYNALEYINDCLELNYLNKRYDNEGWSYELPEKSDILRFLYKIERKNPNEVFYPRYEFLKMRAYGAIKDDDAILKLYERDKDMKMSDALRNRFEGYLGGVYYRKQDYIKALDYFSRTNDTNSIQWCIEKLFGFESLSNLYQSNPTSFAIPYIIEDFINYLISSTDAGRSNVAHNDNTIYSPEIRELRGMTNYAVADEKAQMEALCHKVLEEGKTDVPMIWMTALGVIQAMNGDYSKGFATLRAAQVEKGDELARENLNNFTLWALMLNSGRGNQSMDSRFVASFNDMYNKVKKEMEAINRDKSLSDWEKKERYPYEYDFLSNFIAVEGQNHYKSLGAAERSLAFLTLINDLSNLEEYKYSYYYAMIRKLIDKELSLADGKLFIDYIEDAPDNELDKMLHKYVGNYLNLTNDVVGTRLMREGKFQEALPYLSKVDPYWANSENIGPYLELCNVNPATYQFNYKRKKHPAKSASDNTNYKARFCKQLVDAEKAYESLQGEAKALKALELAGMCQFASPLGNGWALSEYSWSTCEEENEFTQLEKNWLDKAAAFTTSPNTRYLIDYAWLMLPSGKGEYYYLHPFGSIYDYTTQQGYYYLDSPTQKQRSVLADLKMNWSQSLPTHIRQCDVLKDYAAGRFGAKPAEEYYGW